MSSTRFLKAATLALVLAAALAATPASAANIVWANGGTGNWTDGANWTGGVVPGSAGSDSAEIGGGTGDGGTAIIDSAVPDVLYWRLGLDTDETGSLQVQAGGSLTTTQSTTNYVGRYGEGHLTVSGGDVVIPAGNMWVGAYADKGSEVTHTAGTVSVDNDIYLSEGAAGNGTYNLGGGTLESRRFLVGLHGIGVMNHTGGTLHARPNAVNPADLTLAWYTDGTGYYNLSGATSQVISDTYVRVGNAGKGFFDQSGGTVAATTYLSLGVASTAEGTYTLSGGEVTSRYAYIGESGTGVVNHSGGTLRTAGVESDLHVGLNASSHGTYNLTGPTATLEVGDDLLVGTSGIGVLKQSDGQVQVTDYIYIGYNAAGDGTYELSGGEATAYRIYVGNSGTGKIIQTGGTLKTVGSDADLYLAANAGSQGTYELSGATSKVIVGDDFYLGNHDTGIFRQSGGEVAVTDDIYISVSSDGDGTYELDGGTLSARRLLVGLRALGTLKQTGGLVDVHTGSSPDTTLAWYTGSHGIYELSDGTLSTRVLRVGNAGLGEFTQTGGAVNVTGSGPDMWIAANAGSEGSSYTLSGPASTLTVDRDLFVGYSAEGTLKQSDGTVTVKDDGFIGHNATGDGTYEMSGGTLHVTDILYVGNSGTGTFKQSGGTVTSDNDVRICDGGPGFYELSGGTIGAKRLLVGTGHSSGSGGTGRLTQTGGEVLIGSSGITLAWYTNSEGIYTISGGTVDTPSLRVGNSGTGRLSVLGDGATIKTTTYNQNGLSTLHPCIGNGGVSLVDVAGSATISSGAKLDVGIHGGVAFTTTKSFDILATATFGNISGSLTVADTPPMWSVTQDTQVVSAALTGAGQGTATFSHSGQEFAVSGGAGANADFLTIDGLIPEQFLWLLLDFGELSPTELDDLAAYIGGSQTVLTAPAWPLLPGSPYDLALELQPTAATSYLAWDFSDYEPNPSLELTHIMFVTPEPATLSLLGLGLAALARRRRRR